MKVWLCAVLLALACGGTKDVAGGDAIVRE
jgi:hypothetical protein